MTAPVIRNFSPTPEFDSYSYPVTVTTIDAGHFVCLEAAVLTLYDAANNDAEFAGVALTTHDALDFRDEITVTERCIVEVDTVAAAYTRGAGLKWSSGSGDTLILVADANANTVCWAAEAKTTAAGNLGLKCFVDVKALKAAADKLWDVSSA